jgi:hypothetical protein
MYNLNYTPTTLGIQSWGEIISGGTRTKRVEYHWSRGLINMGNLCWIWRDVTPCSSETARRFGGTSPACCFPRNIGQHLPDYTVSQPGRWYCGNRVRMVQAGRAGLCTTTCWLAIVPVGPRYVILHHSYFSCAGQKYSSHRNLSFRSNRNCQWSKAQASLFHGVIGIVS